MRHLLTLGGLAIGGLPVGGLVVGPGVAAAQTYEGSAATVGTQWKAGESNLAAYVAAGYRVAAVTQQLTLGDHGIVNVTAYFLQKETSFVRCNELILPTPAAPSNGRDLRAPAAPTVVLGCAEAVTPTPVPFSASAAAIEAVLPGH